MNIINVTVRGKIARAEGRARVVCGNSDYAVRFDFDAEWEAYDLKTARFVTEDGSYTDVQFEGEDCAVPILRNTRTLLVGVFAGNLRTTTAALIHAVPCITDPDGTPADPTPDVYAQLMERFNAMEPPAAVLYTTQELTDEQKATARENIGVATPDWEQSDETAADYIKNRPFYEGTIETLLDPTIENWRTLINHDTLTCSWRVAGVDYIDVIPSTFESGAVTQYKLGTVDVTVISGQGRIGIDPSDADVHLLKRESGVKQIDSKFLPLDQPDWNQSDEAASDYIKNRPFYDDTVILPFASTSTTDAWVIASAAADEFFNNISSYTVRYNGTDYHFDKSATVSWASVEFQGVGGKLNKNYPAAFTSDDIPFVIYRAPNANGSYDGTSAYVGKSISEPPEDITIFRGNIKQIDPKFIPANRFIVRVTRDGNGNFTADKTIAEILEAYEAGKDVVMSNGAEFPLYAITQKGRFAMFNLSNPGGTSQGLMINDTGVQLSDELLIPKINPVEKTSDMTSPVGVDIDGKLWSKADISLNMTGATVGQIAKITAVDDSGKPTAWEAVDMPSGGAGETWEKIAEIVIPDGAEETNALTINKDIDGNSFSLIKARLCVKQPKYTGSSNIPTYCFAMINGKTAGRIAPLAYTNAFCVPSKSLVTGTVYEVDVSGAQQIETIYRSGNGGWSDDTSTDYIVYGSHGVNLIFGKYIGDTLWAKPITSIGGAGMLIYPGCRFVLYGVRA